MNPERPEHTEDILAYLDGVLEAEASAAFEERLHTDELLRRDFEGFAELYSDLDALGRLWPDLDCAPEAPAPDELLGYATRDLDELSLKRVQHRLAECPEAEQEARALEEMGQALHLAGKTISDNLPAVDLVRAVMARIDGLRTAQAESRSVAPELDALFEAYLEDRLSDTSRQVLEATCAAEPEADDLLASWMQLKEDLKSIGPQVARTLPEIDLVGPVMAQIQAARTPVPLQTRPKTLTLHPARRPAALWLGLAAAAVLMLFVGFWTRSEWLPQDTVSPRMARKHTNATVLKSTPSAPAGELPGGSAASMPDFAEEGAVESGAGTVADATPKLARVMETHRAAVEGDADAARRLAQWSLLPPAQARAIATQPEARADAVIGAAHSLPASEAAPLLAKAVAQNANDLHARWALAEKQADAGRFDEAHVQGLQAWGGADAANALPMYMEGNALLERDAYANRSEALAALDAAAKREAVSAYALEHGQRQAQALQSAGVEPGASNYLAAATLGDDAYASVTGLGDNLLRHGGQFEADGDYPTAERIYHAALQLGSQVMVGALTAHERLAGYDVRKNAYEALGGLYDNTGEAENARRMRQESASLTAQLAEWERAESGCAGLLADSEQEAAAAAQTALEQGDLAPCAES